MVLRGKHTGVNPVQADPPRDPIKPTQSPPLQYQMPPGSLGNLGQKMKAMKIRREHGNNHPSLVLFNLFLQGSPHRLFTAGSALNFRVRTIPEQKRHSLSSEFFQAIPFQVLSVHGFLIPFPIASMEYNPLRGPNRQGKTVGDRVSHPNELNGDTFQGQGRPFFHHPQMGFSADPEFLKSLFQKCNREARTIDRHFHGAEDVRDSPNVVLVTVGQEDGLSAALPGIE